jgi:DNA polymerase beta
MDKSVTGIYTIDAKIPFKLKIPLKLKPPKSVELIDLVAIINTESHGDAKIMKKYMIIDKLTELIDRIESNSGNHLPSDNKSDQFRIAQFKKAISSIQSYKGDILSGEHAKTLKGIGKGIATRIDEIIKTGTLEELSKEPSKEHETSIDAKTKSIKELLTVTGIGESHAKKYVDQGVASVEDLKNKIKTSEIKVTHHISVGLDYYYDIQMKIPYEEIVELTTILKTCVNLKFPKLVIQVCGSHRRKRPLSGDMDVLITHPEIKSDEDLISHDTDYLKEIVSILHNEKFLLADLTLYGSTKYMGICTHPKYKIGRRIDIRFVSYDSYYPALLYFTGSMMVNKLMRTIALQKGYKLNEYGLFNMTCGSDDNFAKIVTNSEQEIFSILGIKYLLPEEREQK